MTMKQIIISVPKEVDDVLVLLCDLVKVVKAKGSYVPVIEELVQTISEFPAVPGELKQDLADSLDAVALRGIQIAQTLIS